jgi:enoyl-CoA hydratase/carnithine racemase
LQNSFRPGWGAAFAVKNREESGMDEITLSIEPPLARLRLNKPARRNVVSQAMWRALPDLCRRIEAERDALVVIVEGAGDHFSAGADITEFETVHRSEESTREFVEAIQEGLNALIALDRPSIAALRGNSIGGGLAIALACDLRFCADNVYLAITASKLGLLYNFVETRRLVELVGPSRAKDILFSSRRLDGNEALAIGLVDRVVPTERLDEAVEAYARNLAKLSQYSIRGEKYIIDAIAGGLGAETPALRRVIADAARGEDCVEGRQAFAEKRQANFTFRGSIRKSN